MESKSTVRMESKSTVRVESKSTVRMEIKTHPEATWNSKRYPEAVNV